jgi:hypothetical protein
LKARRLQAIGEIQPNAIREMRAITENAFKEAFQTMGETLGTVYRQ